MAQIALDGAGIDTVVSELITACVSEVVRVNRKRQPGLDAKLGHQLVDTHHIAIGPPRLGVCSSVGVYVGFGSTIPRKARPPSVLKAALLFLDTCLKSAS